MMQVARPMAPRLNLFHSTYGEMTTVGWTPPAVMTEAEWVDTGKLLRQVQGVVSWNLGDWWIFGEEQYGERKALVESDDWDGPSFKTCANAATVCRAFATSRRREVVSFSHHAEVASLDPDDADRLLDWVEETDATRKALRERVKEIKAWAAQGWTTSQRERREQVEAGLAVVATMRKATDGKEVDAALLAWADQRGALVRIDRATDWGNPFEMPQDGDRAAVCDNFGRYYLPHKPSLMRRVSSLRGKVLACWCYPEQCHGDHLAALANGEANA